MVEALLLDGFGTVFEDDQEAWLAVARLVADDAEADAGQVLEYFAPTTWWHRSTTAGRTHLCCPGLARCCVR